MRISDWSSDVCSSDLHEGGRATTAGHPDGADRVHDRVDVRARRTHRGDARGVENPGEVLTGAGAREDLVLQLLVEAVAQEVVDKGPELRGVRRRALGERGPVSDRDLKSVV